MTYDPLAFAQAKSQAIGQIGQAGAQMGATIMALPKILRENEQYRRAEAQYKFDRDQNNDVYNAAQAMVGQAGIDIKLRAPGPKEGRDSYLQYVAGAVAPYVREGKITPDMAQGITQLQGQDAFQTALQAQQFVQDQQARDPLVHNQIDLNGMGGDTAQYAPGGEMVYGEEQDTGQGFTEQGAYPASRVRIQEDPGAYDELARMTVESVKSGQMSPSAALEQMQKIEENKIKLRIEEAKERREAKRQEAQMWQQGVLNRAGTNEIVDPLTGQDTNVTRENIDKVGIGGKRPTVMNYNTSGKGGGGEDDNGQDLTYGYASSDHSVSINDATGSMTEYTKSGGRSSSRRLTSDRAIELFKGAAADDHKNNAVYREMLKEAPSLNISISDANTNELSAGDLADTITADDVNNYDDHDNKITISEILLGVATGGVSFGLGEESGIPGRLPAPATVVNVNGRLMMVGKTHQRMAYGTDAATSEQKYLIGTEDGRYTVSGESVDKREEDKIELVDLATGKRRTFGGNAKQDRSIKNLDQWIEGM